MKGTFITRGAMKGTFIKKRRLHQRWHPGDRGER